MGGIQRYYQQYYRPINMVLAFMLLNVFTVFLGNLRGCLFYQVSSGAVPQKNPAQVFNRLARFMKIPRLSVIRLSLCQAIKMVASRLSCQFKVISS